MKSSSYAGWWVLALVLLLVSTGLSYWRFASLVDLPIDLGPDLSVRNSQNIEATDSSMRVSRGDRLNALNGHAIKDLSDVRSIVITLIEAAGPQANEPISIDYQAVRPLHRFTLTLRGESFDGTMLPLGVEPTDDLVEVDGRALPGKVGPEGLKSIMASRPEAVLGFERRNAVFGGKIQVQQTTLGYAYLGVYGIAAFVLLLLVQLRSRRLDPRFAVSVALETVLYATVVLLVLRYQWVVADVVMAAAVVTAAVTVRPIAFIGRAFTSDSETSAGPFLSFGLAVIAAIAVNVLMMRGMLTTERALQFAAVTGGLYIVYELIAGFARAAGSSSTQERSIYLVGVIVVCALAAVFEYLAEPTRFLEDEWVLYAVIAIGLVWFSDVILCLRGPAVSGLDELETSEIRQAKISDYFEAVSDELDEVVFRIILYRPERSVSLSRGIVGFEVNAVDTALHDAMTIMIDEGARIPVLASTDAHTDPMAGIARTMRIKLATVIPPPTGGAQIPNVHLILLGFDPDKDNDEMTLAPIEALEQAHKLMTGTIWTASLLEGVPHLASETIEIGPPEPAIAPEKVEALETRISELESEAEDLHKDQSGLEESVAILQSHFTEEIGPPIDIASSLVEPELLEGLDYLLESQEPIVIAGPKGGGKRYTAYLAHAQDQEFEGNLMQVDAARIADARGFPDVESIDEMLFEAAKGGAVVVKSCGLLTAQQIKALLHKAKESFRLYLLFDIDDPQARSALESYPDLLDQLEHRELMVPPFRTRQSIKKAVVQYYLNETALRLRKDVLGISSAAWELIMDHPFHGEIEECKVLVQTAVARTESEVLDESDFLTGV